MSLVIGAGPAGVVAALRAARLGARTALVTRDELGGMAANDGPVPVRTLAHAARLMREARQLPRYGISAREPTLDYSRLLARVREVTGEVRKHSLLRDDLRRAGVTIYEHAGTARLRRPACDRVRECERGCESTKVIICTGGASRRLAVAGIRADLHPQRRLASLVCARIAAGDRRRCDRRAGRLDLQRLRVTGHSVRGGPPNPHERGRAGGRCDEHCAASVRRAGPRGRRERSSASSRVPPAYDSSIPRVMRLQQSTRRLRSSRSAGSQTPTGSISPPPGYGPTRAATSRWTPSSARPRLASTPPETSPGI